MAIPPPHGMSKVACEALEAAVETVRGRWFPAEFARHSKQAGMLDAMARAGARQ